MKQVIFIYTVNATNIKDIRFQPTTFLIEANLLQLAGVTPVVQIKFVNADVLDIMNVVDMGLVKMECEKFAVSHFKSLEQTDTKQLA